MFTRPHVIELIEDLLFSILESGSKNIRIRCRIRRMRVDGSRIRKERGGLKNTWMRVDWASVQIKKLTSVFHVSFLLLARFPAVLCTGLPKRLEKKPSPLIDDMWNHEPQLGGLSWFRSKL